MRYGMIMAGGAGTRLWPMSKPEQPKQLLPLMHGRSLLEIAAARLGGIVEDQHRFICTGERYRAAIRERMPDIGDDQILGEPEGRDTLNAVAYTAAVLHRQDPDAVFAVLTADHLITPEDEFQRKVALGFDLVEDDPHRIVTFSITPTFAATGYGYVELGDEIDGFAPATDAKQFREKPDAATAQSYLDAGTFGWNSGMFIFHAGSVMETVKRFRPDHYEPMLAIASAWGGNHFRDVIGAEYPKLEKISVDYAIMEPASTDDTLKVVAVPMAVQWMDVGSWPSFGETLEHDANGNAATSATRHIDAKNVLCVSDDPKHLIATIGCEDLIIVRTKDATLVCAADRAEEVKQLAE
ncbi:MAG: sugar phosphate nucleotidyltransferase [Planctomycetota bacterium]